MVEQCESFEFSDVASSLLWRRIEKRTMDCAHTDNSLDLSAKRPCNAVRRLPLYYTAVQKSWYPQKQHLYEEASSVLAVWHLDCLIPGYVYNMQTFRLLAIPAGTPNRFQSTTTTRKTSNGCTRMRYEYTSAAAVVGLLVCAGNCSSECYHRYVLVRRLST